MKKYINSHKPEFLPRPVAVEVVNIIEGDWEPNLRRGWHKDLKSLKGKISSRLESGDKKICIRDLSSREEKLLDELMLEHKDVLSRIYEWLP